MFVLPGIVLLVVFIYLRPQEYVVELQQVPALYLLFGVAVVALATDLRLRLTQLERPPHLPWVVLLFGWGILGVAVKSSPDTGATVLSLTIVVILYFLIALGVQTFRGLQLVAAVLLMLALALSAIGVHQGLSPRRCHVIDYAQGGEVGVSDGRPCTDRRSCEREGAEPGADYMCERAGLLKTHTIGGRVRFRGVLQDPNDLALVITITLPLVFAFWERRRGAVRGVLLAGTVGLIGTCNLFTKSRGGQLVLLAVLGTYFVRRYGKPGLLAAAVLVSPALAMGGRSGSEAEASSTTRLECWYEGLSMLRSSPVLGVGHGHFLDHHVQTAHNAYVLAAAELGLPGLFLWTMVIYLSFKIPVQALRLADRAPGAIAPVARTWALAMLATFAGLAVGIFFLSFSYHQTLWIYIGLSAALYGAIRRHAPAFRVELGGRDYLFVASLDVLLLVLLFVYTRLKVG